MGLTKKRYYQNVYLREFTGKVMECRKEEGRFAVELDETAFYPEGGGQPYDTGTLGNVRVLEVQEKDGTIFHYTDGPLAVGEEVKGEICWERRFDLMQQHSGEHIVSGRVHERFGYDNVGFHMGADRITIDFNGEITREQMAELEAEVNRYLWEDHPVNSTWPDRTTLEKLPYRSKKELAGEVRIVEFPGADLCACCGLHVTHTGEIGLVKLISVEKFREGVRMEMLSGERAMAYLRRIWEENQKISVLLSAKEEETEKAARRLTQENFRLKGRVMEWEERFFTAKAKALTGAGDVCLIQEGLEAEEVRKLAAAVMESCGGRCGVFSPNPEGGAKYALGQAGGDLREFVKKMNGELSGRGGGKPFFAQGQLQAETEQIRKFMKREGFSLAE